MVHGEKTTPAEAQPVQRPEEGPITAQRVWSRGPGWRERMSRASEPREGFRLYLRTGEATVGCLSREPTL